MRVLHICRDYLGSSVHSELYKQLDKYDLHQTIFCITRNESENKFPKNTSCKSELKNTLLFAHNILKPHHRVLFFSKTKKSINDIEKTINVASYDLIHATTLFTDGAVGYYLSKKYQIPLVTTVRNTDYNDFIFYAPHLWLLGRKIIKHSSNIIFLTNSLKTKFINHFIFRDLSGILGKKLYILPNGINSYWINNLHLIKNNSHNILYVGNFGHNKNVKRLIRVVLQLKEKFPDIHLDIVGDSKDNHKILKLIKKNQSIISYHGVISDKDILKEIYRNNRIFCMASFHETFGLVYIEALSQGLNVIFSKNEGIDGLFKKNIGIAVNPYSDKNLYNAISSLIINDSDYCLLKKEQFQLFQWESIANHYYLLYKNILSK